MQPISTDDPELHFERALGDGPLRAVRRVSAALLADAADPEAAFYALAAGEPLVLTELDDLHEDDAASRAGVTLDALPVLLAGAELEGYSRATGERESFAAAEFVRELRSGHARHNVVDHPVSATPLAGHLRTPRFLKTNWLQEPGTEESALSLTVSATGTLTALHVDACGIQGWMQLLEGRKRWKLVAPAFARERMDPATAEVSLAPADAWDGVERWEADLAAGELIFLPPGWAHLVWTTEASLGIGASMINAFCIDESMRSWLAERALGFSEELDLVKLVTDHDALRPVPAGHSAREGHHASHSAAKSSRDSET